MITLVEYFKRTGKIPRKSFVGDKKPNASKILEEAFKLPPEEAVNYLKAKSNNIVDQETFDKLDSESKDKAFTVAKIASADMLSDFLNLVTKAKEESWDIKKFKENAINLGQKAWSAKSDGYIGNRLKTIYQTNMDIAYAKGKYDKQMVAGETGVAKYVQWMPSNASEPRKLHEKFYNKIFRYDDPFIKAKYPPCDFGCQCWIRSISEEEIKKNNLVVTSGKEVIKNLNKDLQKEYIDELQNGLKITEQFKPDTTKYVDSVRKDLEKALKEGKALTEIPPYNENDIQNFLRYGNVDGSEEVWRNFDLQTKTNHILKDIELTSLFDYSKEGYGDLNRALRGITTKTIEHIAYEKILNATLDNLETFEGTVYRGTRLNESEFDKYESAMWNNIPYIDQAFVSTSKNRDRALSFRQNVFFTIKSKTGKDINQFSNYGPNVQTDPTKIEQEVLFKSGTQFKVISVDKISGKIELEEV